MDCAIDLDRLDTLRAKSASFEEATDGVTELRRLNFARNRVWSDPVAIARADHSSTCGTIRCSSSWVIARRRMVDHTGNDAGIKQETKETTAM